jgi:hypothetical protein
MECDLEDAAVTGICNCSHHINAGLQSTLSNVVEAPFELRTCY